MLTQKENELLTRVGPGTPMGELVRQYWIPFLLSWELRQPDCPPVRVRLLGESLIAFRDTGGRVGLLAENCSHRGASLFFGRNEKGGLCCSYHGWKYDVEGRCIDMPNESPETNFKERIRHGAYPCREVAGVVWTYMGPQKEPPPLPQLEWMTVPEEHRILAKRVQYCNWVQALEGEIDSSHLSFAHGRVSDHRPMTPEEEAEADLRNPAGRYQRRDKHPRFEVLDTDYGVLIGARRNAEEGSYYWRISQFLFPFWAIVAAGTEFDNPRRSARAWIPIDDSSVLILGTTFHPLRPLTERERTVLKVGGGPAFIGDDHRLPPTTEPFGAWRPKASMENDFLLDRELQQTTLFCGIPEFWAQDAGQQESMGVIYDRTKEHLGHSDSAIVQVRSRLIKAAKALTDQGVTPPGVDNPELYRVRASVVVLPRSANWVEATAKLRQVISGSNPGGLELGMPVRVSSEGRMMG